jgi:hypothetical protein
MILWKCDQLECSALEKVEYLLPLGRIHFLRARTWVRGFQIFCSSNIVRKTARLQRVIEKGFGPFGVLYQLYILPINFLHNKRTSPLLSLITVHIDRVPLLINDIVWA